MSGFGEGQLIPLLQAVIVQESETTRLGVAKGSFYKLLLFRVWQGGWDSLRTATAAVTSATSSCYCSGGSKGSGTD